MTMFTNLLDTFTVENKNIYNNYIIYINCIQKLQIPSARCIDKGHTDTIHVYSVTVMTHVKALQAGHSSQGTSDMSLLHRDRELVRELYQVKTHRRTSMTGSVPRQ